MNLSARGHRNRSCFKPALGWGLLRMQVQRPRMYWMCHVDIDTFCTLSHLTCIINNPVRLGLYYSHVAVEETQVRGVKEIAQGHGLVSGFDSKVDFKTTALSVTPWSQRGERVNSTVHCSAILSLGGRVIQRRAEIGNPRTQ